MSQDSNDKIHIMVDIESYDVKPSAVILSIGAVELCPDRPHTTYIQRTDSRQKFYVELDPTTQIDRTVSQSTKEWWSEQPMPIPIGQYSLYAALSEFTNWLRQFGKEPVIWCKGTDFDVAILTDAFQSLYLPVPWKYNNVRDCRTVFKLAQWEPKKASHNALQDAIDQADDLLGALNKLNGVLA